jgi:hypothetical protein
MKGTPDILMAFVDDDPIASPVVVIAPQPSADSPPTVYAENLGGCCDKEVDRDPWRWHAAPRPLVGAGFAAIPTTTPPASILSTSVKCHCDRYLVQPELRGMTGGLCWPCWIGGQADG